MVPDTEPRRRCPTVCAKADGYSRLSVIYFSSVLTVYCKKLSGQWALTPCLVLDLSARHAVVDEDSVMLPCLESRLQC
jgi:hypothetical protein